MGRMSASEKDFEEDEFLKREKYVRYTFKETDADSVYETYVYYLY